MIDFLKALFIKKSNKPCGLCGGKIRKRPGIVKYRVMNEDTHEFDLLEMQICELCSDDLDAQAKLRAELDADK